jgi:hypothetical protein
LRIVAFAATLVAAFVRGFLAWFAPASLFLAFHTVLLAWAGRGAHMHVFEAVYGGLFFLMVIRGLVLRFAPSHRHSFAWVYLVQAMLAVFGHDWLSRSQSASTEPTMPSWTLPRWLLWTYDIVGALFGAYMYFNIAIFAVIVNRHDANEWYMWAVGGTSDCVAVGACVVALISVCSVVCATVFVVACWALGFVIARRPLEFVLSALQFTFYIPSAINVVLTHSVCGGFVSHLARPHKPDVKGHAHPVVASPDTLSLAVRFAVVGAGVRADPYSQWSAASTFRCFSSCVLLCCGVLTCEVHRQMRRRRFRCGNISRRLAKVRLVACCCLLCLLGP